MHLIPYTEEILLTYGSPTKKNYYIYNDTLYIMKEKVRSVDGDTYFSDIVAAILPGDTFQLYLFINRLDYVLRTSIDTIKENGFMLKEN